MHYVAAVCRYLHNNCRIISSVAASASCNSRSSPQSRSVSCFFVAVPSARRRRTRLRKRAVDYYGFCSPNICARSSKLSAARIFSRERVLPPLPSRPHKNSSASRSRYLPSRFLPPPRARDFCSGCTYVCVKIPHRRDEQSQMSLFIATFSNQDGNSFLLQGTKKSLIDC